MADGLKDRVQQRAQQAKGQAGAVALTVASVLSQENVRRRFDEILGAKAAGFISSIISVTNSNAALKQCEPNTIVAAAAVAATLDLPVNPSLWFAYIVPYKNRGEYEAQLQVGYKGFVQLAFRSGQYSTINAGPVFEGEVRPPTPRDRLKGELAWLD